MIIGTDSKNRLLFGEKICDKDCVDKICAYNCD